MSKRIDTNWEEMLRDDELITQEQTGKPMVVLRGLQRLAREAGYCGSSVQLQHVTVGGMGVFQCIYTANFDDGTSWAGTGDCNKGNTVGEFLNYPTAVAESRAEARALRKALGISLLAAEEIGFSTSDVRPTGKIDPSVVRTIETLVDRKGTDVSTIIRTVLGADRASEAVELSSLTVAEGQQIMRFMNSGKSVGGKKADAKTARDRKKEELKKALDDEETA